jgi:hypothetical protein
VIISPSRHGTHLCSEAFPLHPAESHSARTSSTLKKRRKRLSSSLSEDSTEPTLVQEKLEEASRKLIQLTRHVLALKNRPSTMTLSSPKWTNIPKKRITLYKLCKELHHTCSSDSRTRSDRDPATSEMSSPEQKDTYDPRHWRPSSTVTSSLSSSPRSEVRSPPAVTPTELPPAITLTELPPAHQSEVLLALTEVICDHLSFSFSDPD